MFPSAKILIRFPLIAAVFAVALLPACSRNEKPDIAAVERMLLDQHILKTAGSRMKILSCDRKTSRSECGWNIVLTLDRGDVDFSKLRLLDPEAEALFLEHLRRTEEFADCASSVDPGSVDLYRPEKADNILGFPVLLCGKKECLVLLYNAK